MGNFSFKELEIPKKIKIGMNVWDVYDATGIEFGVFRNPSIHVFKLHILYV